MLIFIHVRDLQTKILWLKNHGFIGFHSFFVTGREPDGNQRKLRNTTMSCATRRFGPRRKGVVVVKFVEVDLAQNF